MNKSSLKTGTYLLVFVIGIGIGLLAGGELIRRIYGISFTKSNNGAIVADTSKLQQPKTNTPPDFLVENSRRNAIVNATKLVSPCVVGIVVIAVEKVMRPWYPDDFFNFFFDYNLPYYREVEMMGSGFVIRSDGLILTNYHVVQGAQKLYVTFQDGRQIEGKIIGIDPQTDLALISVSGGTFDCVKLGNSDELMIGEWAVAIGNPFGYFIADAHPSVTVGVISAINRNFAPSKHIYYQNMIQTDAAINMGNSGGPLVNSLGEVIGINTFIFTGSESNKGSIGMGFAIPINRAKRVVKELLTYGKRRQVWTGISVQDLTRSIAMALGYDKSYGVVVTDVKKSSPGSDAGIVPGDIILKMGERRIQSVSGLQGFFSNYFVGDTVNIDLFRKGRIVSTSIILQQHH